MSSLAATQSDGYYLPPEYFESGDYKRVSRNRYAAETEAKSRNGGTALSRNQKKKLNVGHNQWLKHGVVRFELPEKAVCLGCRQSVGKGTRFNARKLKTDEAYQGTPVFELQLKCRNCQESWVIRTDPREEGFTYISGVKRQAGQDRNLHEGESSVSLGGAAAEMVVGGRRDTLEAMEAAAAVAHHRPTTRSTTTVFRTEVEELEALVKLNDAASGAGRDVDHNASIRKAFRSDRREHRRRLVRATSLGWRRGMALLPSSTGDLLAAKETCYGRAHRDERANLAGVRRSSIFGGRDAKMGKRKRRRRARRPEQEIASGGGGGDGPETVASGSSSGGRPSPIVSGGASGDIPHATQAGSQTPTPERTASSSSLPQLSKNSTPSIPRKTTTLRLSNGVVSVVGRSNDQSLAASKATFETTGQRTFEQNEQGSSSKNPPTSFLDLMGSYGSSDDDEK